MGSVLFLGGSRSGKSRAAEQMAATHGGRVGVAVFGRRGIDAEFDRRIDQHREERPSGWLTEEVHDAIAWSTDVPLLHVDVLLVDCVGTWLSAVAETVGYERAEELVVERCSALAGLVGLHVIFVSNEVGSSLTPLSESGRGFSDALGRINQHLASVCTRSYLLVAGMTISLNDLDTAPNWRNFE